MALPSIQKSFINFCLETYRHEESFYSAIATCLMLFLPFVIGIAKTKLTNCLTHEASLTIRSEAGCPNNLLKHLDFMSAGLNLHLPLNTTPRKYSFLYWLNDLNFIYIKPILLGLAVLLQMIFTGYKAEILRIKRHQNQKVFTVVSAKFLSSQYKSREQSSEAENTVYDKRQQITFVAIMEYFPLTYLPIL